MARSRRFDELLNRLAAAEERFLQSEFLAPVLRGGTVHVRIAGVVCRLAVEADFEGWGVFRPTGPAAARLVRPATLAERRRYLELLPQRRLILCQPARRHWLAWPAHQGDRRFADPGPVRAWLVEEGQRFEAILARFDGAQFWFEALDGRSDPAAADFLRESLRREVSPGDLHRPGLSAEQRAAYALVDGLRKEAQRDRTEDRLRRALAHAGAELHGYQEREDGYRIDYRVDGERHVSLVGKQDFAVQLAGICLSGQDQDFDLQSLVGVLREARGEGVPRVGPDNLGMGEEQYWRAHPPGE